MEKIEDELVEVRPGIHVLVPKKLSEIEVTALLEQRWVVNTISTNTKDVLSFSLPPGFELEEKKTFDWDKLQSNGVRNTLSFGYQSVTEGVWKVKKNKEKPNINYIRDYHKKLPGPVDSATITAEDLIDDPLLLDELNLNIETAAKETRPYVVDFEFCGHTTKNHHNPFCLESLHTPLQVAFADSTWDGINVPWNYYSAPRTSGPFHTDDFSLNSLNTMIAGSTKLFVFIRQEHRIKFEECVSDALQLKGKEKHCEARLRTNRCLVTLKQLEAWGVPFIVALQNPGDFILIKGNVYHMVVNFGWSINRAVNCSDDDYLSLLKPQCNCNYYHEDNRSKRARPDANMLRDNWIRFIGLNKPDWPARYKDFQEQEARRQKAINCLRGSKLGSFSDSSTLVEYPGAENLSASAGQGQEACDNQSVCEDPDQFVDNPDLVKEDREVPELNGETEVYSHHSGSDVVESDQEPDTFFGVYINRALATPLEPETSKQCSELNNLTPTTASKETEVATANQSCSESNSSESGTEQTTEEGSDYEPPNQPTKRKASQPIKPAAKKKSSAKSRSGIFKSKQEKIYSCPNSECELKFINKSEATFHFSHAHLHTGGVKCRFCGKQFSRNGNVYKHWRTGSCQKIDAASLKRHLELSADTDRKSKMV